jgi:proton-dependent oligopeptide transporter, POT family
MSSAVAAPLNNRWPKQIKFIIGNEAAERFSYYGMRSILTLYITAALLQTKDRATSIIHLFVFVNYFMPLFGGWVSDRIWGRYRTILWISLSYCVGHGVLALSDCFDSTGAKLNCLYLGLGLIAFGSGGIKPCVSAFMGDQFSGDQGHLMRKAYAAFYFAINFGSFFSFLVIPWIAARHAPLAADAGFFDRILWQVKHAGFSGYSWAFGVPGLLMALATLIFWLGTKHYIRQPPARETHTAGFFKVFFEAFRHSNAAPAGVRTAAVISVLTAAVLPALGTIGMLVVALYDIFFHATPPAVLAIGWIAVSLLGLWFALLLVASLWFRSELPETFWAGARQRFNAGEISAARSVAPILAVFSFIVPFWTLWDQSLSTWVMQGEQMKPFTFLGVFVGAEQIQSLNSIFVLILLPVLTLGLYPLLEKLGLRVTSLRRMSAGMVLMMFCFVLVAWFQRQIEGGAQLSLALQAWPYLILTIAEVLVSTTGLEFAYTQAAASMKSVIMGFFFLTTALGNLLIVTITKLGSGHGDESVSSGRFYFYAAMMAVVGVLFTIVAARYRYRDEPEVQSRN